ncbi:hypothetical protein Tco_0193692 [Tanacetum coccineum]
MVAATEPKTMQISDALTSEAVREWKSIKKLKKRGNMGNIARIEKWTKIDFAIIKKDQSEDFSDSNVDSTSTDEDSFSSNDIEYVEASPPNSEPVSSKVMEIVYYRVWKD